MDDKQRFYERLNGMVAVLSVMIQEGKNFNAVEALVEINNMMKKLEEDGCTSHDLDKSILQTNNIN